MIINKDVLLQRIETLCVKKKITRTTAFVESGVGKNFKSNLTSSNPSEGKITMLANYFGVSVDYLIGDTTDPTPSKVLSPDGLTAFYLTPHETKVMNAYRTHPEMQPAVDKLLGVTEDGVIVLSQAARSAEHRKPGYEQKPVEKWTAIENAPETDDDLL